MQLFAERAETRKQECVGNSKSLIVFLIPQLLLAVQLYPIIVSEIWKKTTF